MNRSEDDRLSVYGYDDDRRSVQAVETGFALVVGVAAACTAGAVVGPVLPAYAGWIAGAAGLIGLLSVLVPAAWRGL